jgi:hypothetical protein
VIRLVPTRVRATIPAVAENRVFASNALFDRWVSAGSADLVGARLRTRATGESYAVEEAVHITAEVSGGGDASGLVGHVRKVSELLSLGAEILDRSMVVGDLAYDIVPGFLVSPLGRSGGRVPARSIIAALSALSFAPGRSQSDEELLARYLIEKL